MAVQTQALRAGRSFGCRLKRHGFPPTQECHPSIFISFRICHNVIPAQAGIHASAAGQKFVDSLPGNIRSLIPR